MKKFEYVQKLNLQKQQDTPTITVKDITDRLRDFYQVSKVLKLLLH